jgi:hypothetical protein
MSDVAMALIQTGQSKPEQMNNFGNTALIWACKYNMPDVAMALIQTGQSKPEYSNYIALQYAEKNNMNEVVAEILSEYATGLNPITKEHVNLYTWSQNKDNLIFVVPANSVPICLPRSFFNFNAIPETHIILTCDKDNILSAIDFLKYLNLEHYLLFLKPTIIELEYEFKRNIINKQNQFFRFTKLYEDFGYSQLQYVAFTDYRKALQDYSVGWDSPINWYLRDGISYFETNEIFKQKQIELEYGKTLDEAKENIINHIKIIDECFLKFATITTKNDNLSVWRGMTISYPFADSNCCLYHIIVGEEIPFIRLGSTSENNHESEILLPRDLIATLISETTETFGREMGKVYTIRVEKTHIYQYEPISSDTCVKFDSVELHVDSQMDLKRPIQQEGKTVVGGLRCIKNNTKKQHIKSNKINHKKRKTKLKKHKHQTKKHKHQTKKHKHY